MHVMGGFGVASLVLSIAAYKHKKLSLLEVLLAYAVIATGWELYELVGDLMSGSLWNGWSDTTSDFINGALGATGAYYLLKK